MTAGGDEFKRKSGTGRRRVLSLIPPPEDPQGILYKAVGHHPRIGLRNPVEESW